MFAVPVTAFSAASCLNQLNLLKDFPSEQFSISWPLYVQCNLIFLFEKVLTESFEWRNCGMEGTGFGGCGHSFENRRKHIFS
jgi:hypothetical protein